MNARHLRYFAEVARCGSFTRAAERLKVAQPAISVAVRKLEEDLQLALFKRDERRVSLTDEGVQLLRHAEIILRALDDAELEMRELRGLQAGQVRVGIPSMMGSYYFPPILMAFKHRYPNLNLSVIEGGTWELQQMLERRELDLAVIVEDFVPAELTAERFFRAQMMVTVAADHPFAQLPSVSYEAFFAEELVMFQAGFFHRRVVERLAQSCGMQPKIGFETNLVPLIKSIVKQGFGISTLMKIVVEDDDQLAAIPFSEAVWLDLCIAWRRDGYLSVANRAFVEFVLAQRAL